MHYQAVGHNVLLVSNMTLKAYFFIPKSLPDPDLRVYLVNVILFQNHTGLGLDWLQSPVTKYFFLIILFDNPPKYNQKYYNFKGWSLVTSFYIYVISVDY